MKSPYLASRNHSRRFSLAGSTAGLDTAPACTTSAGVAPAGLKACTTRAGAVRTSAAGAVRAPLACVGRAPAAGVVRAFRPAVAIASAMSATPANTRKRIRSSEVQPHRQLDDARRARRVGDADRGPEVRVDEPWLFHDVARRVAVTAARRTREGRRVEEARERIAGSRQRIADHDRADEVEARLGAREAGPVARSPPVRSTLSVVVSVNFAQSPETKSFSPDACQPS